MKSKYNINEVRRKLGIGDNSKVGDIMRIRFEPTYDNEIEDLLNWLEKNKYIALAGDRHVLTGKILYK